MLQGDKRKGIVIEDNVWLGGSVIVLDDVTIGKNSKYCWSGYNNNKRCTTQHFVVQ